MTSQTRNYVRVTGGVVILIAIVGFILLLSNQSDVATVSVSAVASPTAPPTEAAPAGEATPTLKDAMLYFADDDPYHGPEDAPVIMIEFSDYLCPWCGKFYFDTLPQLLEAYPDQLRFVHRDYPVLGMFDEDAPLRAAVTAGCAREQGLFWEMHTALMEPYRDMDMSQHGRPPSGEEGDDGGMPDPSEREARNSAYTAENLRATAETVGLDMTAYDACVAAQSPAAEVQHDLADGNGLGLTSVPTYIINGAIVQGAQSFETFSEIIDQALAERPLS